MKLVTLLIIILLISCNFTEHTKQQVDNEVLKSMQAMNTEVQAMRKDFAFSYSNKLSKLTDTASKQKLETLFMLVENANYFMDSLKKTMDVFDYMNAPNTELIKNSFLYKGIGDSLFNKINSSITAAKNATNNELQKNKIIAAQDSLFDKPNDQLAEQLFGVTNALSASMIIYGLQTELYRINIMALKDE